MSHRFQGWLVPKPYLINTRFSNERSRGHETRASHVVIKHVLVTWFLDKPRVRVLTSFLPKRIWQLKREAGCFPASRRNLCAPFIQNDQISDFSHKIRYKFYQIWWQTSLNLVTLSTLDRAPWGVWPFAGYLQPSFCLVAKLRAAPSFVGWTSEPEANINHLNQVCISQVSFQKLLLKVYRTILWS